MAEVRVDLFREFAQLWRKRDRAAGKFDDAADHERFAALEKVLASDTATLLGGVSLKDILAGVPSPAEAGYRHLLQSVFEMTDPNPSEVLDEARWNFMYAVSVGQLPIGSVAELRDRFRTTASGALRCVVTPPWPQEAMRHIETCLAGLSLRHADMLRRYHGIGMERQTFDQIGAHYRISGSVVADHARRAYRDLRVPRHARVLRLLVTPVAAQIAERLEEEVSRYSPQIRMIVTDPAVLMRRVDTLELSVRTLNCLHDACVGYIGHLIQLREAQLLRLKNFGRKCLKEVREILGELGLTLGMTRVIDGSPVAFLVELKRRYLAAFPSGIRNATPGEFVAGAEFAKLYEATVMNLPVIMYGRHATLQESPIPPSLAISILKLTAHEPAGQRRSPLSAILAQIENDEKARAAR
jgi:hypothetical protein